MEEKEIVTEIPKGFYITEVPVSFQKVIAKGDQVVNVDELIVRLANALEDAGLLKEVN
jgi:hypothetical protein